MKPNPPWPPTDILAGTCKRSSSASFAQSDTSGQSLAPEIPPIFILGSDWRKITGTLVNTLPAGSTLAKAQYDSSVKVLCRDVELFRIVQQYFRIHKAEFYTRPLQEERTLKVVIKGLQSRISKSEVTNDLKFKTYVKHVR